MNRELFTVKLGDMLLVAALVILLVPMPEFSLGGLLVPEGPRHVAILHETDPPDAAFEREINLLRTEHAAYLESKGHKLVVLDNDLPEVVATFGEYLPEDEAERDRRRIIVVRDKESKEHIYHGDSPLSAQDVIDLLKKHGG